jgi:hypothetical protein
MIPNKRKKKPSRTGKTKRFELTERHKRFCQNLMAGMSQLSAYVDAGFGRVNAGPRILLNRPEVDRYLKRLQERQRIRLNVTLDRLVLDLCRGQDLAAETGNASAHIAATMGLAKLMGFLKEDRDADINIFINRPLREASKEIELTPDQWVAKWSPKELVKPNGHHGNGESKG